MVQEEASCQLLDLTYCFMLVDFSSSQRETLTFHSYQLCLAQLSKNPSKLFVQKKIKVMSSGTFIKELCPYAFLLKYQSSAAQLSFRASHQCTPPASCVDNVKHNLFQDLLPKYPQSPSTLICMYSTYNFLLCVCVCVCERERERDLQACLLNTSEFIPHVLYNFSLYHVSSLQFATVQEHLYYPIEVDFYYPTVIFKQWAF